MTKEEFLSRVDQIANEKPKYMVGRDGSDGYCDCIGLLKGAVRRCGETWEGGVGSNYCARFGTIGLKAIVSDAELHPGDIVYKHRTADDPKYDLPARYRHGGQDDTGDYNDYCHIGVVTAVHPLRITHMTEPTSKVDTRLGKWSHFGRLYCFADDQEKGKDPMEKVKVGGGNTEKPINMRATMNSSSRLIAEIPQGAEVMLVSWGPTWSEIQYNGKGGYVRTEYIKREGDGEKVMITLSAESVRALLPILDELAAQLADQSGRG